jgi:dihydrofolate reductase
VARFVLDISVSLDGFAAGPNVREAEPMGDGGERLHAWMFQDEPGDEVDAAVRRAKDSDIGAALVGRRTFDLGVGPWGGTPWPGVPAFVVTHRPREVFTGDNGGTFTFDAWEGAVRGAREAARDREVQVLGPTIGRQLLRAGLLDELRLHVVPILLGAGTPLFDGDVADLVPVGRADVGTVTHHRFRVDRVRHA